MSSVTKLLAVFVIISASVCVAATTTLRVCADPNNLPFSDQAQQGFENHLADMVAKDLGMRVTYYWFPQRSAFFRKTLNAGECDVVMGVPAGIPVASTTLPYYQSSYVFVTRRASHLDIKSMDDPRLHQLRIGVHITGDQDSNLPPVNALLSRGIVHNLVGYSLYGKLSEPNPPSDLIHAVAGNHVDVAIAWGPIAGYFARRASVPLDVTPVDVVSPDPRMPFIFAISMGVRHGDRALLRQLNAEIQRREPQFRQILKSYGVPLLATPPAARVGE